MPSMETLIQLAAELMLISKCINACNTWSFLACRMRVISHYMTSKVVNSLEVFSISYSTSINLWPLKLVIHFWFVRYMLNFIFMCVNNRKITVPCFFARLIVLDNFFFLFDMSRRGRILPWLSGIDLPTENILGCQWKKMSKMHPMEVQKFGMNHLRLPSETT